MNEIEFCERDTNTVKSNVIAAFESVSGRKLAKADPVRLFLEAIADLIIQQREIIDNSAKMNLLYYSNGDYLDHIGYLVGCMRNPASKATTTVKITLSAARPRAITIPQGTRFGEASSKIVFATDEDITILAGNTTATVSATALEEGAQYNDYAVGELDKIIDPIAYVSSMVNTTKTEGGSDVESDDEYRERIRLAPERFSVAGPDGAYEYWTKTASSLITDVAVTSPTPGNVDIYPLLEGGVIPGQEIFNAIMDVLNDDVRPLTDHVTVKAPTKIDYDVSVKYYISKDNKTSESAIRASVEKAVADYVLWQKSKMGRDINPSALISYIVGAGAKRVDVTSPIFTVVNSNSVAIADNISITYGGPEDG